MAIRESHDQGSANASTEARAAELAGTAWRTQCPASLNNGGLRGSVANERRMNSLAAFATKENDREHNKRNS